MPCLRLSFSLTMPCLSMKADSLGTSRGLIGDALFRPVPRDAGPAPIPRVTAIFRSPWQLVVFDACFAEMKGAKPRIGEWQRTCGAGKEQNTSTALRPRKKRTGTEREEWRQGEGREDLSHLCMD